MSFLDEVNGITSKKTTTSSGSSSGFLGGIRQLDEREQKLSKLKAEAETAAAESRRLNSPASLAVETVKGIPKTVWQGAKALVDDPMRVLATPVIRAEQAIAASAGRAIGGDFGGRLERAANQPMTLPSALGGQGGTIEPQRGFDNGGAAQIAGDAAQYAATIYTGGRAKPLVDLAGKGFIKQAAIQGSKEGAIGMGGYMGGAEASREGSTAGSIAMESGKGLALGGFLGGVLGGGGAALAKPGALRAAAEAEATRMRPLPVRDDGSPGGSSSTAKDLTEDEFMKGQGTPLYHGTNQDFNAFSNASRGNSTKMGSAKRGTFFTDSPTEAKSYADFADSNLVANEKAFNKEVSRLTKLQAEAERKAQITRNPSDWEKSAGLTEQLENFYLDETRDNVVKNAKVIEAYADLKNPMVYDFAGAGAKDSTSGGISELIKQARKNGNDGLIMKNIVDDPGKSGIPTTHTVVFDSKNIKTTSQLRAEYQATKSVPAEGNINIRRIKQLPVTGGGRARNVPINRAQEPHLTNAEMPTINMGARTSKSDLPTIDLDAPAPIIKAGNRGSVRPEVRTKAGTKADTGSDFTFESIGPPKLSPRVPKPARAETTAKAPRKASEGLKTPVRSQITAPTGRPVTMDIPRKTATVPVREPKAGEAVTKPKAATDINKKLAAAGFDQVDEDLMPGIASINKADQIEKVARLLEDVEASKKMAYGEIPMPDGVAPQVLFNAVKNRAVQEADGVTLQRLATSKIATERSQAAQTLGSSGFNNGPADAIDAMQDITKTRTKAAERRKQPSDAKKEVKTEKAFIKKAQAKRTWDDVVDGLTC